MQKKSGTRRLTALVLAAVMTLALAAPAGAAEQEQQVTAWEDMEYEHYDPAAFYDGVDELTALADGEDAEAIIRLYDELFQEMVAAATDYTIADLHHNMDVTDEYWEQEQTYCDTLITEMDDAFSIACGKVTAGPSAEAFKDHVGEDAAEYYSEYVPATDRELELLDRELELVNEYYEKQNQRDSLTYTYQGREWTEALLYSRQGDILYERDQEGYWEVYDGLQEALNEQVGPIFVELLQVRTELAEIWEYDSYIQAAYEDIYGRDYSPDDAQMLCDAVKQFSGDYYDSLYYSDLWSMFDAVSPQLSAEEQLEILGQYVGQVDPKLEEVWQFMTDNGLCYLTDDENAIDTGFTTMLAAYDCPFIYNHMYDNCYDLADLSHEFGHFSDHYFNKAPDPVTSVGSYDLFEIHSNGLEALLTEYYGEIYDEGADVAEFIVLGSLVESILEGCIHDEFQRRVYAQPDMTLDEINETYTDVCREYGKPVSDVDYGWQEIPHNFEDPLYYISYAVSALAALQIWDAAQADRQKGVEMYMDVLDRGGYGDGYLTVLEQSGMRLFTEEGAVEDICQPVIDYMEDLERAELYAAAAA